MDKVIDGISKFKKNVYPQHEKLFRDLANGQSPEVLFITCSDSRIDPGMITQSAPGDLFICRNAGNIVPPHTKHTGGMTASIEFGVAVLGVEHIVICGHTDCGAMKGALNPEGLDELPHVCDWLSHCDAARRTVKDNYPTLEGKERLDKMTEENVVLQLQHLRTHPYVASKLAAGKIQIHGWVYNIGDGSFTIYNEHTKSFEPLAETDIKHIS